MYCNELNDQFAIPFSNVTVDTLFPRYILDDPNEPALRVKYFLIPFSRTDLGSVDITLC